MIPLHELDAPTFAGGRVLFFRGGNCPLLAHDIPHPMGDPDEDGGLPGEDEDDDEEDEEEEDEEEEDEEPMQLCGGARFAPQHKLRNSGIIKPLRRLRAKFSRSHF